VSAAASPLTVALRGLRARRSINVGYHGVDDVPPASDPEFHCVHPEAFRAQLDLLATAGFEFVTVAELAERAGGGEPPPGLAALSFDDGMENNCRTLLPILEDRGIPATVYVVSGLIGRPNPWMKDPDARMMNETELRELAAAGLEIGAHTVTHPDLSEMSFDDCLAEMVTSREALERIAGVPVRTFAYPFCRFGQAALEAAQEAGFAAAVTCEGHGAWRPHAMKRALVTGKDGHMSFVAKVADLYYPLFESTPGRLGRWATRGARRRVRVLTERRRG